MHLGFSGSAGAVAPLRLPGRSWSRGEIPGQEEWLPLFVTKVQKPAYSPAGPDIRPEFCEANCASFLERRVFLKAKEVPRDPIPEVSSQQVNQHSESNRCDCTRRRQADELKHVPPDVRFREKLPSENACRNRLDQKK
jgi:hypothetical protein